MSTSAAIGGPHGQGAGVEEGAVAQVLEVVRVVGERGQADPLGPLAAHLGHADLVCPGPRRASATMMWQPIPSPTSWSSSARVEMLWGQPEQKNGARPAGRPTGPRPATCRVSRSSAAAPAASVATARAGPAVAQHRGDHLGGDRAGGRDQRSRRPRRSGRRSPAGGAGGRGLLQLCLDERRSCPRRPGPRRPRRRIARSGQRLDRPGQPDADQADAELVEVGVGSPRSARARSTVAKAGPGATIATRGRSRLEVAVEGGVVGVLAAPGGAGTRAGPRSASSDWRPDRIGSCISRPRSGRGMKSAGSARVTVAAPSAMSATILRPPTVPA